MGRIGDDMPLQLYAGMEKYSCDLCGPGPRPTHTVTHLESGDKADICDVCYGKSLAHPPFIEDIKQGKIKVEDRP